MAQEVKFAESFGRFAGVGDFLSLTLENGDKVTARIEYDETAGPPWEEGDGYGIVSEWRPADSKKPGERIMYRDRHGSQVRFYDVEATTEKARAEGWGCGLKSHTHKTKGEEIACAVEQDFAFHKAWCEDEWQYVGIVLKVERPDGFKKDYAASVWGIECGYDTESYKAADYLTECANEVLSEYLHE